MCFILVYFYKRSLYPSNPSSIDMTNKIYNENLYYRDLVNSFIRCFKLSLVSTALYISPSVTNQSRWKKFLLPRKKSRVSLPLRDWSNANNLFQVHSCLWGRTSIRNFEEIERAENRYLHLFSRSKFYNLSRFNGRIYICIEVEKKMIWKKSREEETRP